MKAKDRKRLKQQAASGHLIQLLTPAPRRRGRPRKTKGPDLWGFYQKRGWGGILDKLLEHIKARDIREAVKEAVDFRLHSYHLRECTYGTGPRHWFIQEPRNPALACPDHARNARQVRWRANMKRPGRRKLRK